MNDGKRFNGTLDELESLIEMTVVKTLSKFNGTSIEPLGPQYMGVQQYANYIGVHRSTVRRMVKAGKLETVETVGKNYKIVVRD